MRVEDRIILVKRLAKRDGKGCFYCKVDLPLGTETLDHFIPKSLGGPSTFENFRLSCQKCNNRKGSIVPDGKRHPVPPPRQPRRTREEKRALKALRGVICGACYDGRINTARCQDCGRDPFPPERSFTTKVKAYECRHDGSTWCWWCCILPPEEKALVSA